MLSFGGVESRHDLHDILAGSRSTCPLGLGVGVFLGRVIKKKKA